MEKIWIFTVARENDADGLAINTELYNNECDAKNDMERLVKKLVEDDKFTVIEQSENLFECQKDDYDDYYLITIQDKKINNKLRGLEVCKEKFNVNTFEAWVKTIDFKRDINRNQHILIPEDAWGYIDIMLTVDTEQDGIEETYISGENDLVNFVRKNLLEKNGEIYSLKIDFYFNDSDFSDEFPQYIEGYVYYGMTNKGITVMSCY